MSNKSFRLVLVFVLIVILVACTKGESEVKEEVTSDLAGENVNSDSSPVEEVEIEESIEDISEDTKNNETEQSEVTSYDPNTPVYKVNGVWYEIFVRGFADSNDDGIGDLLGIVKKLDYLNDNDPNTSSDLGINGIWLMPINPSPSYHGYDVTDYYDINPDYGSMEDFELLIEEAHNRGIKVIIDLVLNHSSAKHPWFKEGIADENSIYRDYYRIVDENTQGYNFQKFVWNHPVWNKVGSDYYYAIFWDQMPDLNYDNDVLREEMIQVASFWLEKGVDGFRIDAVSHIFGSGELEKGVSYEAKIDDWWNSFNQAMREVNPDYYLVGEAWEANDARLNYNKYFDSSFNFDMAESSILAMAKNGIDFQAKNNGLINELTKIYSKIEERNFPFIDAPFLTNHDQRRAMDYLNGNVVDMKLAANIYLTLPGNPFIYYGEEIGMFGNKPDENIREPFIWGSEDEFQTSWKALDYNSETVSVMEQEANENSLLSHYKELIRVRTSNKALLSGDFVGVETESPRVVAYIRSTDEQKILVIHNLSDEIQALSFDELGISSAQLVYSSLEGSLINESLLSIEAKSTLIIEIN